METLYPKLILDALTNVRYPGNGKNIVELGMVEDDIRIDGNKVSFSLVFDRPTDPFVKSLVKAAETAINTYISPEIEVKGNVAVKFRNANQAPAKENPLPGVKNIIGVSSGKGVSENQPLQAILPWRWLGRDIRSGCLMLTFSDLPCLRCLEWRMLRFIWKMSMAAI